MKKGKTQFFNRMISLLLAVILVAQGLLPMQVKAAQRTIPEVAEGKGHIVTIEDYSGGKGKFILEPTRVDLGGKKRADAIRKALSDSGMGEVEVIEKTTTPDFPYIDSIAGIKGNDPIPGDYVMNDPVFGPRQWMVSFNNKVDPWDYLNWKAGAENGVIRIIFTENNGEDVGGLRSGKLTVNKDELARTIADARAKRADLEKEIEAALAVLTDSSAEQVTVDTAAADLKESMDKPQEKPDEIPEEKPVLPQVEKGKGHIISVENYTGGTGSYLLEPVRVDLNGKRRADAVRKAFSDCGIDDVEIIEKITTPDFPYIDSIAGIKGNDPIPGDYVMNDPVFGPRQWMVSFNNKVDPWDYLNWKVGAENGVIRIIFTENNGVDVGGLKGSKLKVNKDDLVRAIADARLSVPGLKEEIAEANKLVLSNTADQDAVNAQAQKLTALTEQSQKPQAPKTEAVTIEGEDRREVHVGDVVEFKAVKTPADSKDEIVWSVDREEFADIDSSTGRFTAKKGGSVTVAAKAGDVSDSVTVDIKNDTTGLKITIDGQEASETVIRKNEKIRLQAVKEPVDATDEVIWKSSNEQAAKVDSLGNVTGLKAGSTVITATAGNVKSEITILVKEIPASALIVSERQVAVKEAESVKVTATVAPADSTDEITWKSGDEETATVEDGVIKGKKPGETVVTVTAGKQSAEIKVTVLEGSFIYFEYKDGRPSQRIDKKTNAFTLSTIDEGTFKIGNYSGNVFYDCEQDVTDHNGDLSTEYIIKNDGTFDPYKTGVIRGAAAVLDDRVISFDINVVSSGITELRAKVNGEIHSMTDPFIVQGATTAWITVEGRRNDKEEFIPIPHQAVAYTTSSPLSARVDRKGKLDLNSGAVITVMLEENFDVSTQFKTQVGAVHVESMTVNLPEKFLIDKWNSLGGYYVGVQPHSGYQISFTPANVTDKSVTWEALTPEIATHMQAFDNGIIPKRAGVAKFRVTSNDNPAVSQEVSIEFGYLNPAESVYLDQSEYEINVGQVIPLAFEFAPGNASEQRFDWSFSKEDVVKIEETVKTDVSGTSAKWFEHKLIGLKDGEVTVTGTPMDQTGGCNQVVFTVKVGKGSVDPEVGPNPKPQPEPEKPSTTPKVYDPASTVSVRAEGITKDHDIKVLLLGKNDPDVVKMRKSLPSNEGLIRIYDVNVFNEKNLDSYKGEMLISLPVPKGFEGRTLSVLTMDEDMVTKRAGIVKNDRIELKVNSLGSFGIVIDKNDNSLVSNPGAIMLANELSFENVSDGVEASLNKVMNYLVKQTPSPIVGVIGGEWAVMSLARSGKITEDIQKNYVKNLLDTLDAKKGVLHRSKYTEYSRVVMALSAIGMDPSNIGGYNLLQPLAEFNKVRMQGINGPIFALIAFDTRDYSIPKMDDTQKGEQTTRDGLISYILENQLPDGGWGLVNTPDDMTPMAIQSLAPYYDRPEVKAAVDKALDVWSNLQESDGGFNDNGGSETISQTIIALSALDPELLSSPAFVKNGNSIVDALLSYQDVNGSFKHLEHGVEDGMSTEQAALALTAYVRAMGGNNRLYDMTDVKMQGGITESPERVERFKGELDRISDHPTLEDKEDIYRLAAELEYMGSFEEKEEAEAAVEALKAEMDKQQKVLENWDHDMWTKLHPGNITINDKGTVTDLRDRYQAMSKENRQYLELAEELISAEEEILVIENGASILWGLKDEVTAQQPETVRPQQPGTEKPVVVPEQSKKPLQLSNVKEEKITDTVEDHVVKAEVFEKYKGENKNLKIEGDGYVLTINGMDIENAADMDTKIVSGSEYAEDIEQLAEDTPYIFHFAHKGRFPGEMMVEMKVELEDGEYLLLRYNKDDRSAEYMQKVTVKDGMTKFLVKEGGDYFISKKVKSTSLNEKEEVKVEDVTAAKEEGKTTPILPIVGVVAVIALGAVLVVMKKKRGEN